MFRLLLTVSGVFAVLLGLLLLVAPHLYLGAYLDDVTGLGFSARRLAPVVIGLGGVLFVIARMPPGPVPARFAMITACVWFGVAATGVYEFSVGTAKPAILLAALSECVLGVLFVLAGRAHRAPLHLTK